MPIYEYHCTECQKKFEELVSSSAVKNPACPKCNSAKTEKLVSLFGGISIAGSGPSCGPSGCANAASCGKSGFS